MVHQIFDTVQYTEFHHSEEIRRRRLSAAGAAAAAAADVAPVLGGAAADGDIAGALAAFGAATPLEARNASVPSADSAAITAARTLCPPLTAAGGD